MLHNLEGLDFTGARQVGTQTQVNKVTAPLGGGQTALRHLIFD